MEEEIAATQKMHLPIDWVTALIGSLTGSCRQMSLSALDLQSLGLSKKHQIETAIDRVEDLNRIICQLTALLEKLLCCWIQENRFWEDGCPDYEHGHK